MDKISPIKKRILQFIESQGITKTIFCEYTGISYSNLKGKSLYSEIGGEQIARILNYYDEISPIWLITGKGKMIKDKVNFIESRKLAENLYGSGTNDKEAPTYLAQGNLVGGDQGSETTHNYGTSEKNNGQVLDILQKELEEKNKIIAKLMEDKDKLMDFFEKMNNLK